MPSLPLVVGAVARPEALHVLLGAFEILFVPLR